MKNALFDKIDQLQEEINARRPLDTYTLQSIKEYFRIGLTYSSNALEGNTLTESETKIVLEEGITIGGKRLADHLEAIGHSDAYNYLYTCIDKQDITEDAIKMLHKLFFYRLNSEYAGVYRNVQTYITGSKYPLPAPQEINYLMQELVTELIALREKMHPVEFVALAHKKLVFIHPFIDGNGRVARLFMNLLLMQAGYIIAIIPPIMRSEYIRCLEKAHTDDTEFIMFIASMIHETQKDYLRIFKS